MIVLLAAVFTMAAQDNRYSPCYLEAMKAGNSYYSQGRYVEARSAFESAKKCNNGNPEAAQKRINDCNTKIRQQNGGSGGRAASFSAVDKTFTVNNVSFTMKPVEGGTFTMGCTYEQGSDCYDDEEPAHSVTVNSFWMGETEVTQALWMAVMGDNPSTFKGDNLPVETVSWDDCQEFVKRLNSKLADKLPSGWRFALPTEAEWEYAARGGKHHSGSKYSGSDNIDYVAWYDGNSGHKPHPVKGKSANDLGLYDMTGNVWEWCSDWYGSYHSTSQTNPKGPSSGSCRVSRGGSWINDAEYSRLANRVNNSPGSREFLSGFRLVLVH